MSGDLVSQQQGGEVVSYSADELQLIRDVCARDCTENEFKLLIQLAKTYRLDPFSRQIWAVKYGNNPAQIFCGRDGYLAIAHRSGQFDGMESGTRKDGSELVGWCRVYRRDMSHPFEVEVYAREYSTGRNLWKDKPRTMIQKVAEAQCLRRAFSISGLYSPEEIDTGEPRMATAAQVREVPRPSPSEPVCEVCGGPLDPEYLETIREKTGGRSMCRECFMKWWEAQQKAQNGGGQ